MRQLNPELMAQIYGQESNDPILMLLEFTHDSFTTFRLVNNTVDIVSRGNTYLAFPVRITLPQDDGESNREVNLEVDNVSREFIDELRGVTTPIGVKIEMILASNPDIVQASIEELKLRNIRYDKFKITAKLYLDDFLSAEMDAERYTPSIFQGLF